ncbi:uncharacterized protein [Takifugu rubripes]|uniref:uncharacterized protein n=1 Tax=Takifugu rubripes TaxID=31033 RepID=UPI0005D21380|nr:uncharacterized protein LOC105416627 [Takifugu rubripes]|eukprot:XP_011603468.1 PREDICTED: uncharacterized protein LOC105416627 [Takifugu rubripes]
MARTTLGAGSPLMEAMVGFALGAIAGCLLGATEDPVEKAVLAMSAAAPLKPLLEDISTVGALGLGTLMGATALTVAMTSMVAGVILAAAVASLFVSTRSCNSSNTETIGLWMSAGTAGAFGTTLSGATLGVVIEWIVKNFGMMGLLGALSMFTVLKPPLNLLFNLLWKRGEACCYMASNDWAKEREEIEMREAEQRQRVAVRIEQKILLLEEGSSSKEESAWITERRQRQELDRRRRQNQEAQLEQKNLQQGIDTVVAKHVDFLAFSGMPMTVVAVVTSGFGLFGYGNHPFVFVAILLVLALVAYGLLKSSNFKFWMSMGCMAMFVTFIVAVLTLHAGQVVITSAMKMRRPAQDRESISAEMKHQSCVEALSSAIFAAKLCQLGLGATVGGPLVRYLAREVRVILGAALVAMALLGGILVLSPVLGEGGKAGALLGVVGVTGVCVGAAAALSGRWSSWPGTLGTVAGLTVGAVQVGRGHVLNIGLQLPVAFIFAMSDPF